LCAKSELHETVSISVITVCFAQLNIDTPEEGGPLTLTVTLDKPSSSEINIQITTNDGSATG